MELSTVLAQTPFVRFSLITHLLNNVVEMNTFHEKSFDTGILTLTIKIGTSYALEFLIFL